MKAIILEKPGQFQPIELDPPAKPSRGEALVRVRRIGICGTDFHAFRGTHPFIQYPRILGHELGVEIAEVGGNDRGLKAGDVCSVDPYFFCGECIACRHGKTNCCVRMDVFGVHSDGGMRELFRIPVAKLHKSDKLSADQLALVETLGIGAQAVRRAQIERGEFALVIGVGPIGLSVIQFAQLQGARVIAMDLSEKRLEFCRRQFKVELAILAKHDPLNRIKEVTLGDLPAVVFDATGNLESMSQALQYVAAGGRLVFVGVHAGDVRFSDAEFHRREATPLASRNSTAAEFKRIIALMEKGRIDTKPWITHRAAFDEMIPQFPRWLNPGAGVVKAMVEV